MTRPARTSRVNTTTGGVMSSAINLMGVLEEGDGDRSVCVGGGDVMEGQPRSLDDSSGTAADTEKQPLNSRIWYNCIYTYLLLPDTQTRLSASSTAE